MPAPSMREQLEEAFDESTEEQQETGGSEEDAPEPLGTTTETTGDGPTGEEGGDEHDKDDDASAGVPDKRGKAEAKGTEVAGAEDKSGDLGLKAPVSWKPAAREHWAKIPADAQAEIMRRETEIQNGLRQAAQARHFNDDFNRTVHPFTPMIAASGDSALESVRKLMTTAAGLTIGNPVQKAQLAAGIIKQYGIDISMLDSMLVGEEVQNPEANQIQQMLQQELAPVRQFMGQIGQQRDGYYQQQEQGMATEIDTFAHDTKNEFFGDVRETMADLMEVSANQGREMDLRTAYDRACMIHPEISSIVSQRQASDSAANTRKAHGKKRYAASSISGSPATGGGSDQPESLRGALEDAWNDQVG